MDDLTFNTDLSFQDFSDDEVDDAISAITSSLKFEATNGSFLQPLKASEKLIKAFRKRQSEIEELLKQSNLEKSKRGELYLELRVIKKSLEDI